MDWNVPTEWIDLGNTVRCIQPRSVHVFTRTAWYNLTPGRDYLIVELSARRIGTFQRFSWIVNQWAAVFTSVSNQYEIFGEYTIAGRMSFIYYTVPF